MFKNLSYKISQSIHNIIGSKYLTEKNIKKTLDEVRVSLLEGDVALPVVQDFIHAVQKNVIGKNINKYLTPGQEFVRIIHSSLLKIISQGSNFLDLNTQVPAVILVVGLQGAGKTTTVGKLAKFLSSKKNKKVLVVSTDIYRPASFDQLKNLVLFEKKIDIFSSHFNDKSIDIANAALVLAKSECYNVLLIDTAGCLDTDCVLLEELTKIYHIINPIETLFVVDAMIGQVVTNSISVFDKMLSLTGIILTKMDGDTRGGAALSITYLTSKPIKFIGIGEKIDELEPFHPDRIAGRILGMGDMISLVEDIEDRIKLQKKIKCDMRSDSDFNLLNFLDYIKQIRHMGGISKVISKLPNVGFNVNNFQLNYSDKELSRIEAIINSMTIKERLYPNIIEESRKKRIAIGSGVNIEDVTNLLCKFENICILMRQINKDGLFFKTLSKLQNTVFSKFSMR